MLYQRWQQVAAARPHAIALRDLASGRSWTFASLAGEGEAWTGPDPAHPITPQDPERRFRFPHGAGPEFILATLAAWRRREILCPLEPGGTPPLAPAQSDRDSASSPDSGPALPPLPADTVHLKMTSATTGRPRLVAFSEPQLAADADNIVTTMGLDPLSPNLAAISLAHSYGFSNLVLPLLLHGIPLILLASPLPEALRLALDQFPGSTVPAVPALWRAWHEAGALSHRIRLAISAGAPLPARLEQDIFTHTSGLKVHNFYGASECGGIAYDRSSLPRTDDADIGTPLDGAQLSLGEQGCLEVRGPAVGTCYWPDPDPALARGCFQTTDLATLDGGRVRLRGRAGDLINVAGRKVSPETIERELRAHEAVRDCLVFGVPGADRGRGDLVVACVVATPPQARGPREEPLRQFLLSRLPAWQVPKEWRFVDDLAPNQRGKLSRAQWRTRLGF